MTNSKKWRDELGTPAITLAGLQIWVHGRQLEQANDYWDGNWINLTAHCGGKGADVWANGSFVHLPEIERWLIATRELYKSMSGEASLLTMEQQLQVSLRAKDTIGHIEMRVELTPDLPTQHHRFIFKIDQSYLPSVISQCEEVLAAYPIKASV